MNKIYPFKFLASYTESDSHIFFGRDEETNALYEITFQTDLILLYGASGTGKTSLIQCGLASKFNSYDWLPLFIRRGNNLNESFQKVIEETVGDYSEIENEVYQGNRNRATDTMTSIQHKSQLAQNLSAIYEKNFKPIYLIFDQFEELYVLGNKTEQNKFIETVKEVLKVKQPVKIIIAIREEYLGYLNNFEAEVPELFHKKIRIEAMGRNKVQQVLNGINNYQKSKVTLKKGEEDALYDQIFEKVKDKGKRIIQLPYLQVFLDKFYLRIAKDEHRKKEVQFSLSALNKMGDLSNILRDFLDEQVIYVANYFQLRPKVIWQLLSLFVSLEGTKKTISPDALKVDFSKDVLTKILQVLVKRRILRFTKEDQHCEVSYNSLAQQIHAKRSDEDIAIMEMKRLVKSQTSLPMDQREFFSEKQLIRIEPFLDHFEDSSEEKAWINKSRSTIEAKKAEEELKRVKELEDAKARAEKEAKLRAEADKNAKRAKQWAGFFVICAMIALTSTVYAFVQKKEAVTAKNEAYENLIIAYEAQIETEKTKRTKIKEKLIIVEGFGETQIVDSLKLEIVNLNQTINSLKHKIESLK